MSKVKDKINGLIQWLNSMEWLTSGKGKRLKVTTHKRAYAVSLRTVENEANVWKRANLWKRTECPKTEESIWVQNGHLNAYVFTHTCTLMHLPIHTYIHTYIHKYAHTNPHAHKGLIQSRTSTGWEHLPFRPRSPTHCGSASQTIELSSNPVFVCYFWGKSSLRGFKTCIDWELKQGGIAFSSYAEYLDCECFYLLF